jgi:hypothetical protein
MPKREYGTPQDTLVLERLVDFKHELQIDKDVEIRVASVNRGSSWQQLD